MAKNIIMAKLFLVAFIGTVFVTNVKAKKQIIQEKEINHYILDDYNKDIRPEEEHGVPLQVHFEMKLQKIVKLDVKRQEFVVNTFIKMEWRDLQLAWNKTEYENIDKINIGASLIWTPDIVLYNSANLNSFAHTDVYKTKALLQSNGNVIWTAPVTWRVSCSFDVTWFPIDKQICTMTFGSWSYMDTQLQINVGQNENGITNSMINSGEWDLTDATITSKNIKYSCCPHAFSNIEYQITLNRMALYYFLYIILPLTSQIMLFFVIFHIPYDNGERMGFGVTILLGITVYLLVISEKLPEKSDDLPMLGLCFIAEFYILSISLVLSVVIIQLASKKTSPPALMLHLCLGKHKCTEGTAAEDLISMIPMHGSSGYLHSEGESQQEEINKKQRMKVNNPDLNNARWRRICLYLDKICFYVFGGASLLIPLIIGATLDKTMMGV